jgi:hypothetical protein
VVCVASTIVLLGSILSHPAPAVAVEFIEIIEKKIVENSQNQFRMTIDNFDQWVFNNQQKIGGAKKQLLDRLQAESDSVQSTCVLEDDQKEKLLLAGRGDIHAFMQHYAKLRAKFAENINDQQAVQNIWKEIQPLQAKYNGQIYGEGSLFTKVLDHVLDEQQSARMEQLRREQRKFQYQAAVMQLISQFDQAAPITHRKREKLLALIDQHTFPPKSITGSNFNSYLMYFVLSQMAEIPEDELRPLFGEAAWNVIRQQMNQGKAMQRTLKQQGLVPEKD